MYTATSLHIPQPCSESWAAMTPTAAGRHCAACQTTVVDFTLKTDAEILAYLAGAAGGRTCGRFAAGQLDRPLQRAAPAAPAPARWRTWLAAAVAVWGLREAVSLSARAQMPVETQRKIGDAAPEHLRTMRNPDYEGAAGGRVLRGVVRDSATHEVLPGAMLLIKDSTLGTSTAADGTFELHVPDEFVRAGHVELEIKYIGYVGQEHRIATSSTAQPLDFQLQIDVKGMLGGEVVVVGGAFYQKPWPWHPRRLYHWSKYWLTRPFRRF